MKIAFDVDGILTKLQEFQIEYGMKFFLDSERAVDTTKIGFKEMFHCSKEEEDKFWIKNIWRYCLAEQAREDASEIINKLKEEGDEIYILTARVHTTKQNAVGKLFRGMLKYWLHHEKIPYDHIIYYDEESSAKDKAITCLEEGIEFMMDDQPKNIDSLKEVTNVSFFKENYNENCEDKRAIAVRDFKEFYHVISEYKNRDKKCYYRGGNNEKR